MGNFISQCAFIPAPPITEKNCPDQTGKVHMVTGGYTGVGLELCKILYAHNATLVIAGRSQDKADKAIAELKQHAPQSQGALEFLQFDRLHVLTQNAGVMIPPSGSKTAQGEDLTLGTNCTGSWLLYTLLRPALAKTAQLAGTTPGDVRVTWAGSLGTEFVSPRNGVTMTTDDKGQDRPKVLDKYRNYGASKVGNVFMSNEGAKRDAAAGIIHLSWNPGNCNTPLYRNTPTQILNSLFLYPAKYGAYTELYAAVAPEITPAQSGSYIWPWGRTGSLRSDVEKSLTPTSQGGSGYSERFVAWVERETARYAKI